MDGVVNEKVDDVRHEVRNYFHKKYMQEQLPKIELPMGVFKQFYDTTISTLEEIPNAREIKEAV